MRIIAVAALLVLQGLLTGCTSTGGGSLDDFGSSVSSGFVRNGDTYGTNRRMDVYGAATAPSLPTIGAAGFGK